MKCIIQVHPLSSNVLIPIGLLLLLNYHILARSSTFQLSLLSSSNSCQPHFFHKFKKHKNIELHQLFVSSSLQFTTLFDFNSKFWNGTSSCSLHWGIFSVFICTGIFFILWGMRGIFFIICFYLHRIAARRVRAVTSRLVLFSVDDDLFWRTSYMRSSVLNKYTI